MTDHRCPAEDEAAVRNLLGLAAYLNDEGGPEDQRQVWAPDIVWRLGDMVRHGADEMVAAAVARRSEGLLGPGTGVRHTLSLLTVELAGDTAKAISYWATIQGTSIQSSGTYHDELTRTEAGWRISSREILLG
jgi:SnoaL-like domain